jgi:ribose 1,5-bisphosphokinase PhnN
MSVSHFLSLTTGYQDAALKLVTTVFSLALTVLFKRLSQRQKRSESEIRAELAAQRDEARSSHEACRAEVAALRFALEKIHPIKES